MNKLVRCELIIIQLYSELIDDFEEIPFEKIVMRELLLFFEILSEDIHKFFNQNGMALLFLSLQVLYSLILGSVEKEKGWYCIREEPHYNGN